MSETPSEVTTPLPPELADRRVLVVEDDPTVLEVATTYLEAAGLLVSTATDGIAAMRAVAELPPDLVVLDRMLPGIDGVEVCRRLRATSNVPVVMLTALGSTEDRIAGLEAGADDYLSKIDGLFWCKAYRLLYKTKLPLLLYTTVILPCFKWFTGI